MRCFAVAVVAALTVSGPAFSQGYNPYGGGTGGQTLGGSSQPLGGYGGSAPSYGSTGQHEVQGYTRQDGAYVPPHMQTNPNGNASDNWSSRGNVNPYTGQPGTHNPYR